MSTAENSRVIVIYGKANILGLPYQGDSKVEYVNFMPGKNELSKDVWDKINEYNKKRMKHYKFEVIGILKSASSSDDGDDDGIIDITKLKVEDATKVIEATMTISELQQFWGQEQKKSEPRKSAMAAIDAQISKVDEMLAKLEEEKNK